MILTYQSSAKLFLCNMAMDSRNVRESAGPVCQITVKHCIKYLEYIQKAPRGGGGGYMHVQA